MDLNDRQMGKELRFSLAMTHSNFTFEYYYLQSDVHAIAHADVINTLTLIYIARHCPQVDNM